MQLADLRDQGVLVELKLPLSSKRLDVLITGSNPTTNDTAVIVELKQWTTVGRSNITDCVTVDMGGREIDHLHPSRQVAQYQRYLQDTHPAFTDGGVALDACAYLHYATHDPSSPLYAKDFTSLLATNPSFSGDELDSLTSYLDGRVAGPDEGNRILDKVANAAFRPHKRPLDHVARVPGRLITTASADVTMKGLRYLLEALAKLRTEREVSLVVIGREKEGGPSSRMLDDLGLRDIVTFVTGVPEQRIIELYSESQVAVVPSLYEGFSLPAIEAMSCAVPLVATTGGALPEVVGTHNETALCVPPGDSEALAAMIGTALDDEALRDRIGAAGRQRVIDRWTWRHTAVGTVEHYRALLAETAAIQARRPGGAGMAPRFQRPRVATPVGQDG
jgi:glycosyltransferase involved in cell wall biosynthesis